MTVRAGVLLDGRTALLLWQALQKLDTAKLPPAVIAAKESFRMAGSVFLADEQEGFRAGRTCGHESRTSVDLTSTSGDGPVSTAQLADALRVGARHARRFAAANGVTPLRRDRWARADVLALAEARSAS